LSTEERVAQLESAFATLVQLVRDHGERFDTHLAWINQLGSAQANTEEKIAALVNAQIRTEEALTRLAEAQARTERAVAETNARLDRLAEMVERLAGSR
jgi:chromosome segregation ATPase